MSSDEYDFANVGARSDLRRMVQHAEEYSGHVLFCPSCKDFRHARATLQAEDGTPLLKVECKVCGTADYFLVLEDGSTIHAQFAALAHKYAGRRAFEILKERKTDGPRTL